ncbi:MULTISPECIES: hypothetical protein [unclassified Microcoleus]|uniref:hypothetical protein n=1 Tax=unclassified Microcoleus TaxID=2642155 RepID=UPI002FCE9B7F
MTVQKWGKSQFCTILKNGQDARSTKDKFFCGTGILPVHKSLVEKGATSQKHLTFGAKLEI